MTKGIQWMLMGLLDRLYNSTLKWINNISQIEWQFILDNDCFNQFYIWGKLTVSTVTNHTWTTALSVKRLSWSSQNQQGSTVQFTSPKIKTSSSCCYKRHCTEFQKTGTGEKILKATEGTTLEARRTFSLNNPWNGLTRNTVKDSRDIYKWTRCHKKWWKSFEAWFFAPKMHTSNSTCMLCYGILINEHTCKMLVPVLL